jgi:hypothetical protein
MVASEKGQYATIFVVNIGKSAQFSSIHLTLDKRKAPSIINRKSLCLLIMGVL